MILSVSRRTDIPNYYSDWFYNRIKEGFLYVRNPMNAHQISRIDLSPDVVDCIVFWTKNPEAMLGRLSELEAYKYYFQFSITGYGRDVEAGLPDKQKVIIPTFQKLSGLVGKDKVIWRYDPILINEKYTAEYHIRAFTKIADALQGYTTRVVISFVDLYAKTKRNTKDLHIKDLSQEEMRILARQLADIAHQHGLQIESCAELIDLEDVGVKHGCCIDKNLIEKIIGCPLKGSKDKNQRPECGCFESVEIGTYNTCRNGCRYCYANYNQDQVISQTALYDPDSPILCGVINEENGDKINNRKVASLKQDQISFL